MNTVSDIGENALVQRMLAQLPQKTESLFVGPGDDCAVAPYSRTHWQLLKTDAIVEGIHFLPQENFHRVGWKAIARVVSDFAAMGGKPQWFLVTVGLPAHTPVATMESLYQGIASCVSRYQASVVGGETTSVPHGASMVISIAATGVVNKSHLVLRSTAQNGDCVFVTGKLGGSLAGRHLDITPRIDEAQWLAARKFPTAMMDLSDGIATDLPRLATASGLGYELLPEALPCYDGCIISQALTDGEDYELLFTVAPRRIRALTAQWHKTFPHTPLTCIGTMVPAGNGMQLEGGWNHFGKP